jgi:hypothetical protein
VGVDGSSATGLDKRSAAYNEASIDTRRMSAYDLGDAVDHGMVSVFDASYAFLTAITYEVSWSTYSTSDR